MPVICGGSTSKFDGFKIQLLAIVLPFEWIDSLTICCNLHFSQSIDYPNKSKTQNPTSPDEKLGLGVQFIVSP
jgi:hypothetical protein